MLKKILSLVSILTHNQLTQIQTTSNHINSISHTQANHVKIWKVLVKSIIIAQTKEYKYEQYLHFQHQPT